MMDDATATIIHEILDDALAEIEERQPDPFGAIIGFVMAVAFERHGEAGVNIVETATAMNASILRNVVAVNDSAADRNG